MAKYKPKPFVPSIVGSHMRLRRLFRGGHLDQASWPEILTGISDQEIPETLRQDIEETGGQYAQQELELSLAEFDKGVLILKPHYLAV